MMSGEQREVNEKKKLITRRSPLFIYLNFHSAQRAQVFVG